jgi:subtilase family serine protease
LPYGPEQFQAAYGVTDLASKTFSATPTIAIVDAYDNPKVEEDLAVYSSTFGLPPCTSENGCFKKVDQTGGTNYPSADQGWGLEIALDVQAAHAICPHCNILLVEANSAYISDLAVAEEYAHENANVVSNSWGTSEFNGETSYDDSFDSTVPTTVSSGDNGYGVEWPAASPNVTAVGGTTLQLLADGQTRYQETVWSGSGSGCSRYEAQPTWQNGLVSKCNGRIVADVAADADPATGAYVYDTYGYDGWYRVGGTSLAAPLIAGMYALANDSSSADPVVKSAYDAASWGLTGTFFDITSGLNGRCRPSVLCTGTVGYDGPTGLGTPKGIGAF